MKTTLALSTVLGLAACAGSETGNGQQKRPVRVTLQLVNGSDVLEMTDRDGAAFTIGSADLFATRIDFELASQCSGFDDRDETVAPYEESCEDDRMRVDGPWLVDLVTGELEAAGGASAGPIDLLVGDFEAIDVKLEPGIDGVIDLGPADPLNGATLVVGGTYGDSPFALTVRLDAFARFGPGTITTHTDSVNLSLDVHDWFSDLKLGSCIAAGEVPLVDGVLQLQDADKQACGNVVQAVRLGLAQVGKVRVN